MKIEKKIVDCSVVKNDSSVSSVETIHELLDRPAVISGVTYKIKPPESSAFYITINDLILNAGTAHETRRPFEVFINSKDMQYFQWSVALTRMLSAVFRKGGEVSFVIEELKSVHDPKGGWFQKGRYVPSVVAAIGEVLEQRFIELGVIVPDASLALAAKAMVAEKTATTSEHKGLICEKCHEATLVLLDNCLTCTSCGYSKCG